MNLLTTDGYLLNFTYFIDTLNILVYNAILGRDTFEFN